MVRVPHTFPQHYIRSLTHLYQPIIGAVAISIYQTLLSDFELKLAQSRQTHHRLMNYLHLSLDQVYEAKRKLEAVGLLRTFMSQEEEGKLYTYVLHPPFTAKEFFQDDVLSVLLYHELGEDKYNIVKEAFLPQPKALAGEEVTASFEDMFQTTMLHSKSMPQHTNSSRSEDKEQKGVVIGQEVVDFGWLTQSLQQRMYPTQHILNERNKRSINQMAVLYDLGTHEVEKAVMWSLSDEHDFMLKEFKEACHDLYQSKGKQSNPSLLHTRQALATNDSSTDAEEKKNETITERFERISPRELLEDLSDGNQPSYQELKMIRDVMDQQGLPPGVMNVLIHYVYLKTDKKLSKGYLEKIASHWSRKKVKTVQEAMELAKSENENKQQKSYSRSYNRAPQRQGVVPDWFKQNGKASSTQKEQEQSSSPKSSEDTDREREQLLEDLKNLDDL